MDADQKKIAAAFQQIANAAHEIAEILGRRDDLNEAVPSDFPIHMSVDEFACECLGMVSHYNLEAARRTPTESLIETTMKANGFEIEHTGGGCLAWSKFGKDEKGRYSVMISNGPDDIFGDPNETDWFVGFYGEDGAFINFDRGRTWTAACDLAEELFKTLNADDTQWDRFLRNTDIDDYRIE